MSNRKLLIYIVVLAAVLRIGAVIVLGPVDPLGGDFPLFDRMARNLIAGGDFGGEPAITYGSPNINPAFAIFLALLYVLFGTSPSVVIGAQIVLGILLVFGTFLIGANVFNKKTGLIAAAIIAFWPPLVIQTVDYGQSFLLYATLFVFSLTSFSKAVFNTESRNIKYWTLSGVFLGLAALTDSIAFYIPVVLGVWIAGLVLFRKMSLKSAGVGFVSLIIAFSFVLAPWAVRNVQVARGEVRLVAKGEFQLASPENVKKITVNTFSGGFLSEALERLFLRPYGLWRLDSDTRFSYGTRIFFKQLFALLHISLLAAAAYAIIAQWRRLFGSLVILIVAYITVASVGYLAFRGGDFSVISPLSVFLLPLTPIFAILVASKLSKTS